MNLQEKSHKVFDSQNKAVLEDMGQHQYMKLDRKGVNFAEFWVMRMN